jgi:hypothetical protein
MNVELVTKSDLENLRDSLIKEMRSIVGLKADTKKYLKSSEVRDILGCSPGTLQHLRVNGTLEYTKIGGTIYYSSDSVNAVFDRNKRNVA